jgi:hypothetical protein
MKLHKRKLILLFCSSWCGLDLFSVCLLFKGLLNAHFHWRLSYHCYHEKVTHLSRSLSFSCSSITIQLLGIITLCRLLSIQEGRFPSHASNRIIQPSVVFKLVLYNDNANKFSNQKNFHVDASLNNGPRIQG